jgi:hypothetical protein
MQRPTPSQPQLAPASGAPWAPWLVAFALAGLLGLRFSFVIAGAASDFVDFEALHADKLVFERPDTRLNAWILAWVDHTALRAPAELYHGNIHHPERHVLTGSEHLFGIALQLLPFEPFVDGAIARHQLALVLSSALLMATSFWAVHWATGSVWAAALAAAFALGMPWRVSEISHLQLVSAQWLPLVWLGVVRGLLGDTRAPTLALLGVAVGLQLLSSFYLAYFMTLSCAVLVATVVWMRLPRAQHVLRLALAVAPGYALFVASALPYLARQADAGLGALYDPSLPIAPREVLAVLAPRWPWTFELPNEPASYWTPWAIVLLAAIGAAAAFRGERGSPLQALSAGLVGIVVLALVMMLGGGVELAGATIPTPGRLLAEILPGFELLRGPTRWGILAACALPLLAGLGVHALDGLAERRASARVAVALASAATFAWFALPTAPAWEHPGIIEQRYEALAALPPGPLLELPWPTDAGDIEQGSRSVLASALHWRPTLNGYTGHRPRSYRFVQRIAERLPTRRSLEQLQRLTGLRFALLDLLQLREPQRSRWAAAEASGLVRSAHTSLHTRIYELTAVASAGELIGPLVDPEPRARTFDGMARDALDFGAISGVLRLETAPQHERIRRNPARLRIQNAGNRAWPGFDVDPEGLVQLRYSYFPRGAARAAVDATHETRIAALDVDIAPGATVPVSVTLQAPRRSGSYELCADLVQQVEGVLRRLPIREVRRRVSVRGVEDEGELVRLIDSAFKRPAPLPPCGEE